MIMLFWQVLIANWKHATTLLCQHFRWKLYRSCPNYSSRKNIYITAMAFRLLPFASGACIRVASFPVHERVGGVAWVQG